MSSTSALDSNEDLENVTLVKMEDVQPDRSSELYVVSKIYPSVINKVIDHDYICMNDDDESKIDSMESIKSEVADNNTDEPVTLEKTDVTCNSGSWPTLEILPGGVINHSENFLTTLHQSVDNEPDGKVLMYACAKCPERFKFLFALVKHVKLHEDEEKLQKMTTVEIERRVKGRRRIKKNPNTAMSPEDGEDPDVITIDQGGEKESDGRVMMYACAKCSYRFKSMSGLVKHVKLHENQEKLQESQEKLQENQEKLQEITKMQIMSKTQVQSHDDTSKTKVYLRTKKKKKIAKYKTKCKTPKK